MGALPFYFNAVSPAGEAEPGALVDIFSIGTTTRATAYADSDLTTPTANPYVADAAGHILFYLDDSESYTVAVKSADGGTALLPGTLNIGSSTGAISADALVHIADYGAVSDGSTDDSAALAAALATGKSVAIPANKNTIIGTGTTLPALVSFQGIVSDNPAPVWNATLTLQQSITVGNTVTRSDENFIGPGVRVFGSENVTLFNLIYNRKFVIAEGARCTGVHRLATLGNASAAGASYVFYNFGDVAQRYAYLVLSGVSGTYTASETVTGGTSGATALVESWDATSGRLTLRVVSSTTFSVSETVTGGSSGATGTVTSTYRPTHLIQVANHAGDFWSRGTVEGAYCGNANGVDVSGNAHVRFDEFRIEKYWGRFQIGFESTNARSVNGHMYADMEGCLINTARFYTTSATIKSTNEVGFANIYGRVKASVLAGGDCAFSFRTDRANVESETVNLDIQTTDEHTVHGARILCSAGDISNVSLSVKGSVIPASANQYGVDIQQSSTGAIEGIDVETNITQAGATALGACVNVVGSAVTGRIGKTVKSGNVTQRVRFSSTPPAGLEFSVSEGGTSLDRLYPSPDFTYVNIPVAAGDLSLGRGGAGGVIYWRPDRDMRITRLNAEWSAAPTASQVSVKLEVNGSVVDTLTNTGTVTQTGDYDASPHYVLRGQTVRIFITRTGSYATANADLAVGLECVTQWNDK